MRQIKNETLGGILRAYKRSIRESLQAAIFRLPPDLFTVTMKNPENAVYIFAADAGKEAYFLYGRFKSKSLQTEEGFNEQNFSNEGEREKYVVKNALATFSLAAAPKVSVNENDVMNQNLDEEYDLLAFCGWRSQQAGFEKAVREWESLGARRLTGAELKSELENPAFEWILSYALSESEKQQIVEFNSSVL